MNITATIVFGLPPSAPGGRFGPVGRACRRGIDVRSGSLLQFGDAPPSSRGSSGRRYSGKRYSGQSLLARIQSTLIVCGYGVHAWVFPTQLFPTATLNKM